MSENIIELVEEFYQNRLTMFNRHGMENYVFLMKSAMSEQETGIEIPYDFSQFIYSTNEAFLKLTQRVKQHDEKEITVLANVLKERDDKDAIQPRFAQASRESWLMEIIQTNLKSPFAVKWLMDRRLQRSADLLTRPNPDMPYQMGLPFQSALLARHVTGGNSEITNPFCTFMRKMLQPQTVKAINNFITEVDEYFVSPGGMPRYMPIHYQRYFSYSAADLGVSLKEDDLTSHLADAFVHAGIQLTKNIQANSHKPLGVVCPYPN